MTRIWKIFLVQHKGAFEDEGLISFMYSHRQDTCVLKSINALATEHSLYDIKKNHLKTSIDDFRISDQVFLCDKIGVDNVALEKAEKEKGVLFHVPYAEYLDNGEGGRPRTLEALKTLYTRENCQGLFNKKLIEMR